MVSPLFLFEDIMYVDILEDIDHHKILEEANSVKVTLGKGWKDIDQVGLQGHKPDLDPKEEWSASVERLNKLQYPETYFKYPLFDIPNINRLIDKYGLRRTRLMKSNPKTCLTFHHDMTKRVHIPLLTNEDCVMIFDNQTFHLEKGKVYLTDTTKRHTAVNASQSMRLHIVGCVYG